MFLVTDIKMWVDICYITRKGVLEKDFKGAPQILMYRCSHKDW